MIRFLCRFVAVEDGARYRTHGGSSISPANDAFFSLPCGVRVAQQCGTVCTLHIL